MVATICEQANSKGDYAKLSEIRDAILKALSSKKELVAANSYEEYYIKIRTEEQSLIEQTENKSELADKRLLAEKEKALLQAEKVAETKRLLEERKSSLQAKGRENCRD